MAHHILDLTHPLETGMFTWPGDAEFSLTPEGESAHYRANQITISDHGGTHIGTGAHVDPTGLDISQIPPERLISPGVCVDFSTLCEGHSGYLVQVADFLKWEAEMGQIPPEMVVLVATGWDRYWLESQRYYGETDAPHFPGIAPEAIRWLVDERHVSGVGIDTAGIDGGAGIDLAANRILLGEAQFHLENLTNLTQLPVSGFTVYIGALPIRAAGGSPCRVLASWEVEK